MSARRLAGPSRLPWIAGVLSAMIAATCPLPVTGADTSVAPKTEDVITVRPGPPGLTAEEIAKTRLPGTPHAVKSSPRTPSGIAETQTACAIYYLTDGIVASPSVTPTYFTYNQSSLYWAAVGLRSEPGSDWDLDLYDIAGGSCVTGLLATSQYTGSYVDVVVTDYNHAPTGYDYPEVYRYSGTGGASLEWDDGPDILEQNWIVAVDTDSTDVLEIWDAYLYAGVTYEFRITSTGYPVRPEMSVFLFENPGSGAYYAGRNAAALSLSSSIPTGQFTPTTTDWYGLVAVNEDGTAGRYWLSYGRCLSPDHLVSGGIGGYGNGYEWFIADQTVPYWTGIGCRSDSENRELDVFGSPGGSTWPFCFGNEIRGKSAAGYPDVLFFLGDYNGLTPGPFYVQTSVNAGHENTVQWDSGADLVLPLDPPVVRSTGPAHVIEVWDAYLQAGQTYNLDFQTTGAARLELFLVSPIPGLDWYDDSNDIHASTGSCEPVTAGATGYSAVAVVNHDGQTGTYQFRFTYPVIEATSPPLDTPMDARGVSWVDVDSDGDDDLVVADAGGAGRVFRDDGGSFADATAPVIGDGGPPLGTRWADFDNDGDPDMMALGDIGFGQQPRLFRNDGFPALTDVTPATFPVAPDEHVVDACWVDFDRDGNLDVAMALYPGANLLRIYRGDGHGSFLSAGGAEPAGLDIPYSLSWTDYDGDLYPDFYVSTLRTNHLFRTVPGPELVDVTAIAFPGASTDDSYGAVWADLDGDLDPDVYVSNNTPSTDRMWRNDGSVFVDVSSQLPGPMSSRSAVAALDVDNDWAMDLHVAPFHAFGNVFLIGTGAGYFAQSPNPTWSLADYPGGLAYSDADGDGDVDAYVSSNGLYGPAGGHFLQNDLCAGNHWLQVDLEGVVSNRSALGARVSVHSDWLTVRRQLTDNSPIWCQGSHTLHFGLGYRTPVDSVVVEWPSGIRQVVLDPPIDSRITVVERDPGLAASPGGEGTLSLALHAAAPNPFSGTTSIRYDLPAVAAATVRVYDVTGRLVRELVHRTDHPAGRHETVWNGTDAAGRAVGSGVYFVRLEAGDRRATRRIVLLR